MSEPRKTYVSYQSLQMQRLLLAGLILGLLAVIVGVLFEVYYRGARATQISPAIRRLAEPLNPVLNTDVLAQVDEYEQLSLEQIRAQFAANPPSILVSQLAAQQAEEDAASVPIAAEPSSSTATPSATITGDVVQQTVEDNTLSEEESLTDEELDALLNPDQEVQP
jgi:hypothetical protein